MKHSLDTKGLSMTQAQTVSNLCNQAANEIMVALSKINNSFKVLDFNGKMLVKQEAVKMPITIEDQLHTIGQYRACQAFLMEQIKAKDALLVLAKKEPIVTELKVPERPELAEFVATPSVGDQWGWDQLSVAEMAEYWDCEARAAVIGQFIHKGGKLDALRKELPNIELLEWFVAPGHEGKAHPVAVTVHHKEMELWDIHQSLANLHRDLEQKVNYYKAKVKNLVTLENARIHKDNADKLNELHTENNKLLDVYYKEIEDYREKAKIEIGKFEAKRLENIKAISALRIKVDPRFQKLVDELLDKSGEDQKMVVPV